MEQAWSEGPVEEKIEFRFDKEGKKKSKRFVDQRNRTRVVALITQRESRVLPLYYEFCKGKVILLMFSP